jgi:hypothetical protein
MLELKHKIQEIKMESEQVKNLKTLNVDIQNIQIKNIPLYNDILEEIVKRLNMKVIQHFSEPRMNVSFDDSSKLYEMSIHVWNHENPSFLLQFSYYALEHQSLNCNWRMETLGEMELNDKTIEQVVEWINGFRGKTKIVNCFYCGDIKIQH